MLKSFLGIMVLILVNSVTLGQSFSDDLIVDFKNWYKERNISDSRIQYGNLEEMVSPSTVEIDDMSEVYFSKTFFKYTVRRTVYSARVDVDDDGIPEIATLLILGSARYPHLIRPFSKV